MYRRELEGGELTFAASGWTWRNTFVLTDLETGGLWFGGAGPVGNGSLTCVAGPLRDRSLPHLEHQRVVWSRWVADHPGTLVAQGR